MTGKAAARGPEECFPDLARDPWKAELFHRRPSAWPSFHVLFL